MSRFRVLASATPPPPWPVTGPASPQADGLAPVITWMVVFEFSLRQTRYSFFFTFALWRVCIASTTRVYIASTTSSTRFCLSKNFLLLTAVSTQPSPSSICRAMSDLTTNRWNCLVCPGQPPAARVSSFIPWTDRDSQSLGSHIFIWINQELSRQSCEPFLAVGL